MGQTSSHRQTHHNNNNKEEPQLAPQFGNRRTSTRKSTTSKHYPTLVQPLRKDELSLLRDSLLRNGSIMRKNPERRPVTISELKPANPGQGTSGSALPITAEDAAGGSSSSTTQLMAFQLPVDRSAKTDDLAAESSAATAVVAPKEGRNEFYIVGDGYHRTDHCYYRSPNGDFHKLPSDSFHKMSEGCFVRMADGVFRRLEVPTKAQISRRSSRAEEIGDATSQGNGSAATNVKSQLMRFLKRSKSHTPATIAKLQREKEEARAERKQRLSNALRQKNLAATNAASAAGNSSYATGGGGGGTVSSRNNKIVVTMIENGGLPIVATSKAERPKAKESTSEKARTSRIFIPHIDFSLPTRNLKYFQSDCPPDIGT
ncbi:uncharacterized protein LOC128255064 isoform X19 [Drosophila gunungcola]|uniref:uncharacterized protein LOC128255064 isoform X19 n=1 Tax=Drosophila gunungcola TaxID=103775 RepID=UPI0022E80744|nr:uncharacterized protein LOC128255064 isoform X19 [Drosophila gunungcola]